MPPWTGCEQERCDGNKVAPTSRLWWQQKPRLEMISRRGFRLSQMGLGRVELPTSRLSGVRSNHLSYRPCRPQINRRHGRGRKSRTTSPQRATFS